MNLKLQRYSDNGESTLGLLFVNNNFFGHTLEDTHRDAKVAGQTRIPAGYYRMELRDEGGMTKRYAKRFPKMHKGMLWLRKVHNFKYVYIHTGNNKDHSEGCILVADSANNNTVEDGFIGKSTPAYKRLYSMVSKALLAGETVFIRVLDEK